MTNDPLGYESAREIVIEDPVPMTATQRRFAFDAVPVHDLGRAQAAAENRGVPKGQSPKRYPRLGSDYYDLVWEWIEPGGIGEQP